LGKRLCIGLTFLVIFLVLIFPLLIVFTSALEKGIGLYATSILHPEALSAIKLTLLVAAIVVPLNALFGVLVSWTITKYSFKGKSLLLTLIDLPMCVSPVIAGLLFILLLGINSWLGSWLAEYDILIIFNLPGIILATLFVTFPFVARELIPIMQMQGRDEEEAARSLGANMWKTFFHVTLPNIKWGLLYGIILCNARAMGEFGAVSVVSGHIRGQTNTLPLYVEILYNEYNFVASFAIASLLTLIALVTLILKSVVEWKMNHKEEHYVHHSSGHF
jgi:sulfate/thiosulfate transport system permease protein